MLPTLLAVTFSLVATSASAQELPEKQREVSPKVAERLRLASQALRFVRKGIPFSGNQQVALQKTQGNSHYRMQLTRSTSLGARVPGMAGLASKDRLAAQSATIACTGGGNCGENATLALHFLKGLGSAQTFTKAGVQGVDHAFVLIGDIKKDPFHEIVVVDAWVTNPQPLLYSDFVFKKERSQIRTFEVALPSTKAKAQETRQARRAMTRGLRKSFKANPSPLMTKTTTKVSEIKGVWNQAHAANYKFKYVVKGEGGKLKPVRLTHALAKDIPAEFKKRHRTTPRTTQRARVVRPRAAGTTRTRTRARR